MDKQRSWFAEYNTELEATMDPSASQVTQEDASVPRETQFHSLVSLLDRPDPQLREATRGFPEMSLIEASPSDPPKSYVSMTKMERNV